MNRDAPAPQVEAIVAEIAPRERASSAVRLRTAGSQDGGGRVESRLQPAPLQLDGFSLKRGCTLTSSLPGTLTFLLRTFNWISHAP